MAVDWNAISDDDFRLAFRGLVERECPRELRFMRKQRPLFDEIAIWYQSRSN